MNLLLILYHIYILSFYEAFMYLTEVRNYSTGINWFDAAETCGDLGLEYEPPILQTLDSLGNNRFWIGLVRYKEPTPWFEPIGCFSFNISRASSQTSIGYCHARCKRRFNQTKNFGFSIHNKKCLCLSEEIQLNQTINLANCQDNKTSDMMVYKRFDYNDSSGDAEAQCLLSRCLNRQTEFFPHRCSNTSNSIKTLCEDGKPPNSSTSGQFWDIPYREAKQKCQQDDKMLLSPLSCVGDQLSWTKVFRQMITLKKVPAQQTTTAKPVYCLSGKRSNSSTPIIEKEIQCTDKLKWFVCRTSGIKENKDNESLNKDDKSKKESSHLGTIAGSVVGGVITVLGIALGVVYIGRRKTTTHSAGDSHLEKSNANKTNLHEQDIIQDKLKFNYDLVDIENQTKGLTPEDTYTVAQEGEYDVMNSNTRRGNITEGNVYGIAGKSGEGEYDTMKRNPSPSTIQMESLYDRNMVANDIKASESTYDSSEKMKNTKYGEEDLYDHTE